MSIIKYKITPLKYFLICSIFFGSIFVVITPPFQSPDEEIHFLRSYQVSELNLRTDTMGKSIGGNLPVSIEKTFQETKKRPNTMRNLKDTFFGEKSGFEIHERFNKQKFYEFGNSSFYAPIAYTPQAIGISISRMFNGPPILGMYFGRFLNLLTWILLIATSISLIPVKKWLMAFIGLLPMALFIASTLSSDVMSLGLLAVLFSLVLKFIQRKTVLTKKEMLLLIFLSCLLVLSKPVIAVAVVLVFLLPKELFTTKKINRIFKSSFLIISGLVLAIWMKSISGVPIATSSIDVDSGRQLKHIITSPISFLHVIFNTFNTIWSDVIVSSFVGVFGKVDTPLPSIVITIGFISLAILLLEKSPKNELNLERKKKMIILACMCLYFFGVCAALYISYSPYLAKIIVGMQGRYFIPLAILAVPVFGGVLTINSKKARNILIIGVPLFLLCSTVYAISIKNYIAL